MKQEKREFNAPRSWRLFARVRAINHDGRSLSVSLPLSRFSARSAVLRHCMREKAHANVYMRIPSSDIFRWCCTVSSPAGFAHIVSSRATTRLPQCIVTSTATTIVQSSTGRAELHLRIPPSCALYCNGSKNRSARGCLRITTSSSSIFSSREPEVDYSFFVAR